SRPKDCPSPIVAEGAAMAPANRASTLRRLIRSPRCGDQVKHERPFSPRRPASSLPKAAAAAREPGRLEISFWLIVPTADGFANHPQVLDSDSKGARVIVQKTSAINEFLEFWASPPPPQGPAASPGTEGPSIGTCFTVPIREAGGMRPDRSTSSSASRAST